MMDSNGENILVVNLQWHYCIVVSLEALLRVFRKLIVLSVRPSSSKGFSGDYFRNLLKAHTSKASFVA